jgi:hypothetical protein
MKSIALASLLLFSLAASAQDFPRHMVSFGNGLFGWTNQQETFDPESGSTVDNFFRMTDGLNLNYYYSATNRIQLGIEVSTSKQTDGSDSETRTQHMLVAIQYNFSDDLFNAYYLGLGVGTGREYGHTSKQGYRLTRLTAGKRFSLEGIIGGCKNLTYAPAISYAANVYDGEFKSEGLIHARQLTVIPLKFDLLF